MKSRKQKANIYKEKYDNIPRDYQERLAWMYDKLHITSSKADNIINTMRQMLDTFTFSDEILIILYEEPEGSPRPRARYVNRKNLSFHAQQDPGHIQVYSLTGASDKKFFQRLVNEQDFYSLDQLICTPSIVQYDAFLSTPSSFNSIDTYLAEIGIIRPISKPDFDNMEKKYADMFTGNLWLDDALVIKGVIDKYYSILPRVEIRLRFLNMLYNKYQYDSISKRLDDANNVEYFKRNDSHCTNSQ